MHVTAHRWPRRTGLLRAPLPCLFSFRHLKPLRRARGLLLTVLVGVPGAGCAVDGVEPGYERVCRVDDQKDRECNDELLPSTAHEAERQCTLEYRRYYDAYNHLLADCYEPLSCDNWNNIPADETSGDAGAEVTKDGCEANAREEFGETDACKAYCDAWLEAEDELCGRVGSETECLLDNCVHDEQVLANATRCTSRDNCEAYDDCIAAALD